MIANAAPALSRRAFLSASGALVVALAAPAEFAKADLVDRSIVRPDKLSSFISIERDGTVKWDGNVVSMKQLDGHLRAEAAKDPQPEIHLRADKETRYEAVGRVMYAIQRGGVKQVRFANSGKPAN